MIQGPFRGVVALDAHHHARPKDHHMTEADQLDRLIRASEVAKLEGMSTRWLAEPDVPSSTGRLTPRHCALQPWSCAAAD